MEVEEGCRNSMAQKHGPLSVGAASTSGRERKSSRIKRCTTECALESALRRSSLSCAPFAGYSFGAIGSLSQMRPAAEVSAHLSLSPHWLDSHLTIALSSSPKTQV